MQVSLDPDKYYHVFNHANGKENLFINEDNYRFFLQRYIQYINPIADTFAYCLMPNHFHFAVKIKPEKEIVDFVKNTGKDLTGFQNLSGLISKQFSNLFNSYTKSLNKQLNRRGNLFVRPFKRKHIDNEEYLKQLIHYIHFNPIHHGFVDNIKDWQHSSYKTFFSERETNLKRDEVFEWFDDVKNFYFSHQKEIDNKMVLELEL